MQPPKFKLAPGRKLIIALTMPSGSRMAIGQVEGAFALIPIPESGILRGVLAWDSKEAVMRWLEVFKKDNGPEKLKAIMALKPKILQIEVSQ